MIGKYFHNAVNKVIDQHREGLNKKIKAKRDENLWREMIERRQDKDKDHDYFTLIENHPLSWNSLKSKKVNELRGIQEENGHKHVQEVKNIKQLYQNMSIAK